MTTKEDFNLDRFFQILERNPELKRAVCREVTEKNMKGPVAEEDMNGPWLNLAVRLALAQTVEDINEIAREHWQIMFIDRPLKKGFVKLYE